MGTRSKTPSFITEVPLIVDSKQEAELLSRFQGGRQLYNAVLNEAMVRMELARNSELYKGAKKIPRGEKKKRNDAFNEVRKHYRYSEYDLQAYATTVANKSKWIAQKVDSNTQQKLASRAFKASERVLFGQAKKVRYKVPSRFRSMEGKSNKTGIRWKDNCLVWGNLKLRAMIDPSNPVIQHGLASPIKYARVLWRDLNGKRRWYCQLVNEGMPYQKPQNYVFDGLIGLDLNISNIAYVGDDHADLLPFAEGVPTFLYEIAALQRQMQRSQRVNNPDNFEPDFEARKGRKIVVNKGKVKKNSRKWNKSNNYKRLATKKRELQRRKAAYAKNQNRRIVNEILRHGKHIKTENVSVKGWQKRYGKAIAAKSPGFVQSELKRKAEIAGGSFTKFSTQKTALSQTHLNGERIKKPLSQRVHVDKLTGDAMQRDFFSGFLARFVNQDELSCKDAARQYPRSKSILFGAWRRQRINCEKSRQARNPVPDSRQSSSQRRRKRLAR
ncbi:transposase, IS605 family protein [Kalymmatonema gypsitolerans NIES-4073]|nr:transposase, IS605 family protein [Scytonema sp. NIES-4073]